MATFDSMAFRLEKVASPLYAKHDNGEKQPHEPAYCSSRDSIEEIVGGFKL